MGSREAPHHDHERPDDARDPSDPAGLRPAARRARASRRRGPARGAGSPPRRLSPGDGDGGSEVSDAQWEKDRVEQRIQRLEEQLRRARLITDAELRSDRVAVGHRVDVLRADGRERSYVLVSPPQADPRAGRLSSKSPLGDALLGGAVGDVVVLESNGEQITIVSVAPGDDWRAG